MRHSSDKLRPSERLIRLLFHVIVINLLFVGSSISATSNRPDTLVMSSNTRLPVAANRILNEPESVWVEFVELALKYKPLNLGQGFPDFAAPEYLIESLQNATDLRREPNGAVLANQYTRSFGHPRLIRALVDYYRKYRHFDMLERPNEQVLITVGAYEALFTAIMAFVNPGDQVVIIDPAFDAYAPMVELAQGVKIYVPLRLRNETVKNSSFASGQTASLISSGQFELDFNELEGHFKSGKVKMIVLNTPNNPLGKVYSRHELEKLAKLCIEYNVMVLADEVYEQLYYPDTPEGHLSIAKLPGMWQRTITVGSAGKTFSVTGWKVGWALGPGELIKYLQLVHQTAVYTVATPLQEAIARALEQEMSLLEANKETYWHGLRADLLEKRNRMADILKEAQMAPIVPQGGYFMLADFSNLAKQKGDYRDKGRVPDELKRSNSNDFRFARWLSSSRALQVIPASAFYSAQNSHLAADLVRFCFIKRKETLDKLEQIVSSLHSELADGANSTSLVGRSGSPTDDKLKQRPKL